MPVPTNVYFDLTREFNAGERIAILCSGQAVVFYRIAMMSKDGDWILRESETACTKVLQVLHDRGAMYRPGAPLDIRWLANGWSSHFEFRDERGRRVRCDFFTQPPRISAESLDVLFEQPLPAGDLPVIDLVSLIKVKQTQRAKDYPVIGELARRLPPELELELTTDADRIAELAVQHGATSRRPCVRRASGGADVETVYLELAAEIRTQQVADRKRVRAYQDAAVQYTRAVHVLSPEELSLPDSHQRLLTLAEDLLPTGVPDASES